jgi:hypothetical protein
MGPKAVYDAQKSTCKCLEVLRACLVSAYSLIYMRLWSISLLLFFPHGGAHTDVCTFLKTQCFALKSGTYTGLPRKFNGHLCREHELGFDTQKKSTIFEEKEGG